MLQKMTDNNAAIAMTLNRTAKNIRCGFDLIRLIFLVF